VPPPLRLTPSLTHSLTRSRCSAGRAGRAQHLRTHACGHQCEARRVRAPVRRYALTHSLTHSLTHHCTTALLHYCTELLRHYHYLTASLSHCTIVLISHCLTVLLLHSTQPALTHSLTACRAATGHPRTHRCTSRDVQSQDRPQPGLLRDGSAPLTHSRTPRTRQAHQVHAHGSIVAITSGSSASTHCS
jgi:hypothetical protein